MKIIFILPLLCFFLSCSKNDDNSPISNCEYFNYSWIESQQTIEENGVIKYKVVMTTTIYNPSDEVKHCDCEFVSKKDPQGNRFIGKPTNSVTLNRRQTLISSYLSENYLSIEQINLGVDYVRDLPID